MLTRILFIFILSITSLFATHKLMMNVSDVDLEFDLGLDVGQFGSDMGVDSYFVGFGLVSTNDWQGDVIFTVNGLFMNDLPDVEGMRFGMGMKLVYTDNGTESFIAAPFGMVIDYLIPTKKNLPFFGVVSVYYAPGALSFSDAKSYFEIRGELQYELVQSLRMFLGYRSINTNFISADTVFNQTLYGGAKLGF